MQRLLPLLCAIAFAANAHDTDHDRALGDSFAVSRTPPFPEGVAVRGHLAFVSSQATFNDAGAGPSTVTVVDLRGGATRTITIQAFQGNAVTIQIPRDDQAPYALTGRTAQEPDRD